MIVILHQTHFKRFKTISLIKILNKKSMNSNRNLYKLLYLLLFCATLSATAYAQKECELKDVTDLFKSKKDTVAKPVKSHFFFVLPYLGFQPATGFTYGGISQYIFKGSKESKQNSEIYSILKYSQKKQLLFDLVGNVLLNNDKILLKGDYRYYVFTQSNYGLGSDIIPYGIGSSGFNITDIEEPMDYTYLRLHQTVSFKTIDKVYLGGGFHVDAYTKIDDKNLDLANGIETYHYKYSTENNFDLKHYSVMGVSLNAIYDTRPNLINSNKGTYININYRVNPNINNVQSQSGVLFSEFIHYIPLSKKSQQNALAFWLQGQFVTNGTLPYLNLPAIGWDQRSRQGKGYTQGLFRGNNMVSFETEYRFPILCSELISGTVFSNLVTVSDKGRLPLFHTIQPAVGIGLRILLDKGTKTNLVFNYAVGNKSSGFYLNTDESF